MSDRHLPSWTFRAKFPGTPLHQIDFPPRYVTESRRPQAATTDTAMQGAEGV